jgi:hypothetical protein
MNTQQAEESDVIILIRFVFNLKVVKNNGEIEKCNTDQAADEQRSYFLQC